MSGVDQRAVLVDVPELAARHRRVGVRHDGAVVHRERRHRGPAAGDALALHGVEVVDGVPPGLELQVAVGSLDAEQVPDVDVRRDAARWGRVRRTTARRSRGGTARLRPPAGRRGPDRSGRPAGARSRSWRGRSRGARRTAGCRLRASPTRACTRMIRRPRGERVLLDPGEQAECRPPAVGAAGRPRAGSGPARGCRAGCPSGSTRRPCGRRGRRRRRRTARRGCRRSASRCRPRGSTARRAGPRPARRRRTRPGSRPCRRRRPGRGVGSPGRTRRPRSRNDALRCNRICAACRPRSNTCSG